MAKGINCVSYNIHSCRNRKFEPALPEIVETLKNLKCQIIALQEVDMGCSRTNFENQIDIFAKKLNMQPRFHALVDWQKQLTKADYVGKYGLGFLLDQEVEVLEEIKLELPIPNVSYETRGIYILRVKYKNQSISLLNTHLGVSRKEKKIQFKFLTKCLKKEIEVNSKCILFGDFNSPVRFGHFKKTISNLIECRPKSKPKATFPSHFPVFQLDRIFVSQGFNVLESRIVSNSLSKRASDHLPIFCSIEVA